MQIKQFLHGKGVGFWLSCGLALFALAFAIAYQCAYGGTAEYSVMCFVSALVLVAATALLEGFGLHGFAGMAQLVCVMSGLGSFVYVNYYYVSVVLVGIDAAEFSARFIFCVVAYALTLVGSIVNVFVGNGGKVAVGEQTQVAEVDEQ